MVTYSPTWNGFGVLYLSSGADGDGYSRQGGMADMEGRGAGDNGRRVDGATLERVVEADGRVKLAGK